MKRLTELLFLLLIAAMAVGCAVKEPSPTAAPETEALVQRETIPERREEPAPTQPERQVYDTIPRYYQTDYPHDKFSTGTISTSGCSMTCLAMVATYLTNWEYTPDQLAYHFDGYGKDIIDYFEYGNQQMQLPNVRTDDVRDVLQALEEGKVAIAMMDQDSMFTTTQHFIVLAGMTEDGKILVHDPQEERTSHSVYMADGYQNGFPPYALSVGFSGAWIYDKAAMPEEPYLFPAEKPAQPETRYAGYWLTPEDLDLMERFVWVEAREEPEEAQQAVLEVLLNRMASDKFPNTIREVIYLNEFYSRTPQMVYVKEGAVFQEVVERAVFGPYILPEDVFYFSAWEKAGEIWGRLGSYNFLYSRG